jgi:hypothetical protein
VTDVASNARNIKTIFMDRNRLMIRVEDKVSGRFFGPPNLLSIAPPTYSALFLVLGA